jgi:outer membrane immunogenic protein
MTWTGAYAGLNIGYSFGTNGNTNVAAMNNPWLFTASTPGPAGQPIGPNTLNSSFVGGYSFSGTTGNTQGGVIGGAQFGYNFEYNEKLVLGFETDFQGTGINSTSKINGVSYGVQPYQGSANTPYAGAATTAQGTSVIQSGLDWLGTVRGRLGYLYSPNLLIYGTGGFAYGGAYVNVSQSAVENVDHQRCVSNPAAVCGIYVPSAQNI